MRVGCHFTPWEPPPCGFHCPTPATSAQVVVVVVPFMLPVKKPSKHSRLLAAGAQIMIANASCPPSIPIPIFQHWEVGGGAFFALSSQVNSSDHFFSWCKLPGSVS